ncbi:MULTISPECIES: caspase family protein [unclassified Bradyrhizobium]|uniref:caspase family protein n=1 Tax=unclassified Bradyrhizobium TaxID=2631580 RepID=UPI001FF110D8|nr:MULTISPECIES: caspase family protein [unclassified Bradyrhizobium]MCJ9705449.1 caspase family protein [Bradyrhizobium sp. SHOUNA76]MCJ9732784.1 caspase family protein [Bradyrhizobium sp. PRIMUS42]
MKAFRWFSFFLFIWLACGSAHAERRVALVIGNSTYKSVPRLANPVNDAALVGGMFSKAGFDVVDIKLDLTVVDMRKALREFGAKARDSDVAVIYYAGHGIELDGNNYLIPTDAALETDTDVLDETFPLDRVLFAIEPARQLRLVILDACRDNPFAKTMKRTVAARAIGRGLAKVEPASPNTMIAFAAKAGSTASDGDWKNSPFATALVERLPIPGLDLRKALGFVRDDVLKNTGYKQEPYVYGSLGGNDVPLVPAKPVVTAPQASTLDAVRRDYELALQAGDREGWEAFLRAFPDGYYADLAKVQLKKIAAEETRAAAAEKARLAEEEKTRLAASRAQKAEQEKAAAAAKAAEDARLVAERAKQIEEARAAAAEQRRKDAEAAATALAAKQSADKALADKIAEDKSAAELAARLPTEKGQESANQKVAAIAPTSAEPSLSPQETAKLIQSELRRVGCLSAAADGDWNASSQRSLLTFNKYAGTKFEAKLATFDVLDAIKAKPGRVCPLVCEHGFKPDGEVCVKINCRTDYRVNAENECEKTNSRKPVATRDQPTTREDARQQGGKSTKPVAQRSGQMVCNGAGCRPVRPGCHLEVYQQGKHGPGSWGPNQEVCN